MHQNDNYKNTRKGKKSQGVKSEISILYRYKRDFLDLLSSRYLEIAKGDDDVDFQRWAVNVYDCFNFFQAGIFSHNIQKIFKAQTCQDRLCPACNHRRSLRTFAKLIQAVKNEKMQKYRYLHIVLTVRNCEPEELKKTIDELLYSFKKFLFNKRIKAINKGFFRSLEITYNETEKTFHPHLHILLAVNPSYFKNSELYIKQADFTAIWQSSAALDYAPQVSVQALKQGDYSGIAEVAKYAVKESEELIKNIPPRDLKILRLNLFQRRLISTGGIIRKIANEMKLNLSDDNSLTDNISDDDIKDETLKFIVEFLYNRKKKKYEIIEKEKPDF
jgi:plasmid rolling circle replication initiator protein Rep